MDLIPSSWTSFKTPIIVTETNLKLRMDGTDIVTDVTKHLSSNITDMNDDGDNLFQGYSHELTTFASVMCIIFIILGVPGNLITIIALARCKKVRNATAVFIINLSLSDLLFGCFNLPLAASTFLRRSWDHGDLLCRLFPLVRYGLLAVSLFTILSITINRYVMIGHPRIYPRIYRHRYLGLMVASTWICAFGSLIPTWRGVWGTFGLDRSIGSCSILPDKNNKSPKEFLFIMAFIVPCLCIVVCYARIFYIVRKTAMKSHEPALTTSTIRRLGKSPNSPTHDTNRQLLGKSSRTSKEETSENSSSVSNCSYPPSHIIAQHHSHPHQHPNLPTVPAHKEIKDSNVQSTTIQHRPMRPYLSKLPENEMKYIDTSIESDLPPSLSILQIREEPSLNYKATTIIPNAITESDIEGQEVYVDDDVIATEIKEPNNVFHITSLNDNKREQSSNSGTDAHIETDTTPPRKRVFKKSLKTSFTRITKRSQRNSSAHVANTSAASVLYPGRMSQKDRRLLKMILVIFISFIICYLPITVTKIWKGVTEVHTINVMGYVLVYLTTCINPIIYVVMSSEYRQAYWNLLLCRTVAKSRKNGQLTKRRSKLKAPDT